jgi:hypothetical protein
MNTCEKQYRAGTMDEQTLQARACAVWAGLIHINSLGWRKNFVQKRGTATFNTNANHPSSIIKYLGYTEETARVNRGGSWNNNPRNVRAANRNRNTPDNRNNNLGFRLSLPQPGKP